MPHPNHCINCDKPATVVTNGVYYCSACALIEADKQKENKNGKVTSLPIKRASKKKSVESKEET